MEFFARYDVDGSITAGPLRDGNVWSNITPESRFWDEVMELTNNGSDITPYTPPPPPTDYDLPADVPWTRMTDEEAELIQGGIDASPVRTRQIINKATAFATGTDAFDKFKAIIVAALTALRAEAIMGPPLASDLALTAETG